MKRVLMVDDEKPVLDGMGLMIRRDLAAEFEVVGLAASGREAIEKAVTLAPDIVLMDVNMPGIGGLEAIREIRRRGLEPAFVLVTAYERFDIARDALDLGVVEYLLKPVNRDRLASALRRAEAQLAGRSSQAGAELEVQELEERIAGLEAENLLVLLAAGGLPDPAPTSLSLGGSAYPWGFAVCAALQPPPGLADGRAALRDLHARFRHAVRYKTPGAAGPLVGGRAAAIFGLRDETQGAAVADSVHQVLEREFAAELSLGLARFGFGDPSSADRLDRSWRGAVAAASAGPTLPGGRAPQAADAQEAAEWDFGADAAFLDELPTATPERLRAALERVLDQTGDLAPSPSLRGRVVGLLGAAAVFFARRGRIPPSRRAAVFDLSAPSAVADADGLRMAARSWLAGLLEAVAEAPRYSAPVARTIAWIRENYGSPLSLEAAAELAGISPGRLSRVFQAETGRGFAEYLIDWRVARAKELLRQPGASIKQVSAECGYPDPNYFARLFKKETGVTPSTWMAGGTEDDHER